MKKITFILAVLLSVQPFVFAQHTADIINENDARRIIQYLAADSMRGRGNGSPELLRAGIFIGNEFRKSGLNPWPGYFGYYMPFRPFGGQKNVVTDELVWNGQKVLPEAFLYMHLTPGNYAPRSLDGFTVIKVDSFFTEDILASYDHIKSDILLWSNRPQPDKENYFPSRIKTAADGLKRNVLLVCALAPPDSIKLSGVSNYYSNVEYNVAGILPGRSKKNEVILFSAHYDHEGVYARKRKDGILNGANDNASGVTALLMLADYFAKRNDNERTLLFCAFAGEELGLLGSKNFVDVINTKPIVAGINIEMIGIPQYGKNNIFITGYNQSSLPAILEKGFSATPVNVKIGPSEEEKELFKRSDNFPFVEKGVPAHSIMSSDDDDKCYHQPCDEIKRINIPHMTTVIKAIAIAAQSLINGEETPARVN